MLARTSQRPHVSAPNYHEESAHDPGQRQHQQSQLFAGFRANLVAEIVASTSISHY